MAHRRLGILVVAKVGVLDFCGPFEVSSVTRLNVSCHYGENAARSSTPPHGISFSGTQQTAHCPLKIQAAAQVPLQESVRFYISAQWLLRLSRGMLRRCSSFRPGSWRPLGNLPPDADCRVHPSSLCRVFPLKGARVLPHGAARNPGGTGDGEQGVLAGAMSPGAVIFWSITKNLVERRLFWVH